jgi:hypothetical protein
MKYYIGSQTWMNSVGCSKMWKMDTQFRTWKILLEITEIRCEGFGWVQQTSKDPVMDLLECVMNLYNVVNHKGRGKAILVTGHEGP